MLREEWWSKVLVSRSHWNIYRGEREVAFSTTPMVCKWLHYIYISNVRKGHWCSRLCEFWLRLRSPNLRAIHNCGPIVELIDAMLKWLKFRKENRTAISKFNNVFRYSLDLFLNQNLGENKWYEKSFSSKWWYRFLNSV